MIKKIYCTVLLLMVIFLMGCKNVADRIENITPTPYWNTTQTTPPTATKEFFTQTPITGDSQVASPVSTELVQYVANDPTVTETCPNIQSFSHQDHIARGKILFVDFNQNKIMSFDLDTRITKPFVSDNEIVHSYALSYNGKWLAYQSEDETTHKNLLVIATSDENVVFNVPWEDQWEKVSYWLDNERIIIKLVDDGTPALLILNPFSNERKELISNFPNIYFFENPPDWNGAGRVIYNSTLTRAVYAGTNQRYMVWDTESNNLLLYLQTTSFLQFPVKAPQWSLDGNQVIMAAPSKSLEYMNDELFSINRNNEITKLTNLSDNYDRVSIDRYSWSPDGSYIALLFSAFPSSYEMERLAILNYSSNNINLYCIQGNLTSNYRFNPDGYYDLISYTGATWSPDSRKILLENRTAKNSSRIIMVDVIEKTAYQLLEGNVSPIGWMLNAP